MMPHRLILLAAIAACSSAPCSAQEMRDLAPYLMSDRTAEIALARSAAPKHISDSAAVLILTKSGYVQAVRGTNGFICFVQRSFHADIGDPTFWDPINQGPICMNPPAARTVLPEMLKRGEWIMAGLGTAEIARRTRQAYASHVFPMPALGSMGYMLSAEQRLGSGDSHWVPHLMLWFDRALRPADWGLGDANDPIIDASPDDKKSPVRLLLIPVRSWADGTSALPSSAK